MVTSDCQTRDNRNRHERFCCSDHKQDRLLIDNDSSFKRYACKYHPVCKVIEVGISDCQMPGKLMPFTRLWMCVELHKNTS